MGWQVRKPNFLSARHPLYTVSLSVGKLLIHPLIIVLPEVRQTNLNLRSSQTHNNNLLQALISVWQTHVQHEQCVRVFTI